MAQVPTPETSSPKAPLGRGGSESTALRLTGFCQVFGFTARMYYLSGDEVAMRFSIGKQRYAGSYNVRYGQFSRILELMEVREMRPKDKLTPDDYLAQEQDMMWSQALEKLEAADANTMLVSHAITMLIRGAVSSDEAFKDLKVFGVKSDKFVKTYGGGFVPKEGTVEEWARDFLSSCSQQPEVQEQVQPEKSQLGGVRKVEHTEDIIAGIHSKMPPLQPAQSKVFDQVHQRLQIPPKRPSDDYQPGA